MHGHVDVKYVHERWVSVHCGVFLQKVSNPALREGLCSMEWAVRRSSEGWVFSFGSSFCFFVPTTNSNRLLQLTLRYFPLYILETVRFSTTIGWCLI
jgi:hypothetical protein